MLMKSNKRESEPEAKMHFQNLDGFVNKVIIQFGRLGK